MNPELEELRSQVNRLKHTVEALLDFVLVEATRGLSQRPVEAAADSRQPAIELINFHPAEVDSDGNTYHWTGPSRIAAMRCFLDREIHNTLTFHVVGHSIGVERQTPMIYVDGRAIEALTNGTEWTVSIPPNSAIGQLPTIVAIDVSETFCPFDAGQGEDRRHLGIAIQGAVLK